MKSLPCGLGGIALVLALSSPASAQYMYLDSDRDGVHTAADVLHEVGPTVVDIWLDTGHNRDGSVTVCAANPATPLDIFSYLANLRASGGTVSYSTFTNRVSQMGFVQAGSSNNTDFATGVFGLPPGTVLPPGKYLLGTVTVNVMSGTPSLEVIDFGVNSTDPTSFGSHCPGSVFENTITLGYDWFDVDGLLFGPGGGPNQAPTLSPLADMSVLAGEVAIQTINATDPEGQPLTFAETSGLPFMFVATTDQGSGSGHGEIRLAPFAYDVGTTAGSVSVSDGTTSDQATFQIAVSAGPNHPPFVPEIPKLTVIAGQVRSSLLSAGDAEGGTLHFEKTAGPAFASVRELAARNGGASAVLTASPTLCDVGLATATVSITDGLSSQQREVELNVLPPSAPPDLTSHRFTDSGYSIAVCLGDLNKDGLLDVIIAHEIGTAISVFLGRDNGELAPSVAYPVGSLQSAIVVVDLNRDGNLDVGVTNQGASASILLGKGDGTLLPPTAYATGGGPVAIASADMNRDGIPDLVTSNRQSGTVSVLLGAGDGTFAPKRDAVAGESPYTLALGDFNLDGREDIVVTNAVPGGPPFLTLLPGLGDGNFGDAQQITSPGQGFPISLLSADWNWDGAMDLAVADFSNSTIRTLSGRGDGTFTPLVTYSDMPVPPLPFIIAAADLNGDGNADLVVGDGVEVRAMFGDGAGALASPLLFPGSDFGTNAIAIGDMNSDGRPDVVAAGPGVVGIILNRFAPGVPAAAARAFVLGGNRTVPAGPGAGNLSVRVEPVDRSYTNDQVDLTSFALRSEGTGSVSEIHSVETRRNVDGDTDGNGVSEVAAFFSRPDLAALFDKLQVRTTVTAQLTGSLTDARVFCADVTLNVVGTGGHPQTAAFAPNPLNPQSKLTFATGREGPAKALLFDIQGRLIRTLLDTPRLAAGPHEYSFDGKNDRGRSLPSGVYFYRVQSIDGAFDGQIVILK
jgi:hypothetical protein